MGIPDEEIVPGEENPQFHGAVQVLYGSADGLSKRDQFWHQAVPGVKGGFDHGDQFGASLAAGDFDHDGRSDLAIGVPGEGEWETSENRAGAVAVLYGSARGLSADRDQLWHQDVPGVKGGREAEDLFGWSVRAGAFGRSGADDLAVGVVGEDGGGGQDAGRVQVLYGSDDGLTAAGDQEWQQDTPGIKDVPDAADGFGSVSGSMRRERPMNATR